MNLSPLFTHTARFVGLVAVLLTFLTASVAAAPLADDMVTSSFVGEVFFDVNISRVREPLEWGIPNAHVTLYDTKGHYISEVVTDKDGNYIFQNVAIGVYQLQVTAPNGYVVSNNGSLTVHIGEINGLPVYSTSVRYGIFVPVISR